MNSFFKNINIIGIYKELAKFSSQIRKRNKEQDSIFSKIVNSLNEIEADFD